MMPVIEGTMLYLHDLFKKKSSYTHYPHRTDIFTADAKASIRDFRFLLFVEMLPAVGCALATSKSCNVTSCTTCRFLLVHLALWNWYAVVLRLQINVGAEQITPSCSLDCPRIRFNKITLSTTAHSFFSNS
jgi:hypothetical protein